MRFKLLGLLEVSDEGRVIPLPRGKERALLAALLIRANEPVSPDRLIDQLWDERPPEHAAKTVQVYVSRLRKALGADRLKTTPGGYVLEVDERDLDSREFERLAREGREALEAQNLSCAEQLLNDAGALWRGPALADFRFEPFAQAEIRRLEELRAGVQADLIDVRLERGRSNAVIADLERLVTENPLWERPRQQLMLALYRSGRQAEALDQYRKTRRVLGDELGIEPSRELQDLERGILNQDPALAGPARGVRRATARRGAALLLAGGVLITAAATAAAFQLTRSDSGGPRTTASGSAIAVDATTGEVKRRIPAGTTPAAVATLPGAVWLVDADARTVLRVDASSGAVQTVATGATPIEIAAGPDSIWVVSGRPAENAQFVGPVPRTVAKLDPVTGATRAETDIPRSQGVVANTPENRLAVKGGAVWAVAADFAVMRIDAGTGEITATTRALPALEVAAGEGGVWALGDDGTVARLNEKTARPVARVRIPAYVTGIAVGKDAVWVSSAGDGTLWRIPTTGRLVLGKIDVAPGIADVAVGADSVWVANPLAGTIVQVNPETATVRRTIDIGGIPRSIAVRGDTVWIAAVAEPEVSRTEEDGVHPFLPPACDRMLAGDGDANVLVVSDLPLQSGRRIKTSQMAQAIELVLRKHGFRAGRFRIAYQSCDDSIARSGIFDETKCAANARAYGANADVVAVIGTFNSDCAFAELPVLNSASEGPVAMVSPANSAPELTRTTAAGDPTLPASLYPTNRRNFVRVYPTDDLQGAALAVFARDRGRKRVFVLDDGFPGGYGAIIAGGFETSAHRLGLRVVGRTSWDRRAHSYAQLADRVARSGAQAVLVSGFLDSNAGKVIRDLRTRLGRSVDVLAPDGLTPVSSFVAQAGRAALGVHVSLAGIVPQALPPAGRRFVRDYAHAQPGVEIDPFAVYAAQATEVLVDAVARSDGTRESIIRELFETRIRDGLLGSFRFDANGDSSQSPITIVRVRRGGGSRAVGSFEGAVVERVMRPSSKLVAPEQ